MKRIVVLIILLLNCTVLLWSQGSNPLPCGTPKILPDFAAKLDKNSIQRSASDPIRIKVYVVNFIEYSNHTDDYWINNEIQLMNSYFNAHNICFELIGYRSFADDDSMYVMDVRNPRDLAKIQSYRVSNVLTIFLHPYVLNDQGENVGGTAYAIPNTYFSLAVGNMNGYSSAHEAGHCLGLFHTFHGNPDVEDDGACWETVNGSNAGSCGDFVTDTRADPWGLTGNRVNSSCQYIGTATDANGTTYSNPPLQNTMSYWGILLDQCEITTFTAGQMERARLAVYNPFGPLLLVLVDQSNITQTGGTVTNSRIMRATIGTITANDYTLTNTYGGYTAKRVTLTPGSRISITSAGNNFVLRTGTCQ